MNEPKTGRATRKEGQRRREGTREQGRKQQRAREAGMRRKRSRGDGRVGITRAYIDRSSCAGPVSFPSPWARHVNAGGREKRAKTRKEKSRMMAEVGLGSRVLRPAPWAGRGGSVPAGLGAEAGCPHSSTHLGWAPPASTSGRVCPGGVRSMWRAEFTPCPVLPSPAPPTGPSLTL